MPSVVTEQSLETALVYVPEDATHPRQGRVGNSATL